MVGLVLLVYAAGALLIGFVSVEELTTMAPLQGKVAVVTGGSRNGGRGIAVALGAAAVLVYVTGGSIHGTVTTDDPAATIEETAELVSARGGTCVAVWMGHADDTEVAALFERVQREQGRLDLLVNNVWGGYELQDRFCRPSPSGSCRCVNGS